MNDLTAIKEQMKLDRMEMLFNPPIALQEKHLDVMWFCFSHGDHLSAVKTVKRFIGLKARTL